MPLRSPLQEKTTGKPKLLTALRTEIRRLVYSYKTEQAYANWMKRFAYFHNLEHPEKRREPEVVEFLNPK